jgi:hypothetical protein
MLSFSRIASDTRVLRAIEALAEDHTVIAVGYGAGSVPNAAEFISLPEPQPGWPNRIGMAIMGAPANIVPRRAALTHSL